MQAEGRLEGNDHWMMLIMMPMWRREREEEEVCVWKVKDQTTNYNGLVHVQMDFHTKSWSVDHVFFHFLRRRQPVVRQGGESGMKEKTCLSLKHEPLDSWASAVVQSSMRDESFYAEDRG